MRWAVELDGEAIIFFKSVQLLVYAADIDNNRAVSSALSRLDK